MRKLAAVFSLDKQDALMSLVTLFWGLTFLFTKFGLQSFDPVTFATLRTANAAVILNILAGFQIRSKGGGHFQMRDHILAFALGLLGMALFPWCFSLAMKSTSSANGGLIFGTTPVVVSLISVIIGFERSTIGNWAGALLSLIGIFLIVNPQKISFSSTTFVGDLIMAGAMCLWAIYTVSNRLVSDYIPCLQLTAYASLWGLTAITVLNFPHLAQVSWGNILPISWLGAVLSGILGTALSYVLWNGNVKKVGPTKTAIYLNLVPLVAIISGFLLLDEPLHWFHLPAGLAVISGVLLTKLDNRRQKQTLPPRWRFH